MGTHEYRALRSRQSADSDWLTFFVAPATEILHWGGIPQKKQLGESETTGFQREVNPLRIRQLAKFYNDPKNTIQNPLLCATRNSAQHSITFVPDDETDETSQTGFLRVDLADPESLSLRELLLKVKAGLEDRVPTLKDRELDEGRLASLRSRAQEAGHDVGGDDSGGDDESGSEEGEEAGNDASNDQENYAAVVEDESHIMDFWEEVAARAAVLAEIGDGFDGDEFLGYTRDAMLSFLKPVIVVDGQHRLQGAIRAAKAEIDDSEELQTRVAELIDAGADAKAAEKEVLSTVSRRLPVSLLMNEDPAEHVFQFVIVNQKATPIKKPLLGTIISTTLSNDELKGVSGRLSAAGIQLEDSRAIASLTRDPNSPFYSLVEKGLASESSADVLAWSVFGGLVRMFRNLQGGKLFGSKNDYADKWRRDFLAGSAIVHDWEALGFDDAESAWRSADGPWRGVFIQFWTTVKDYFGNTTDKEAHNHWGSPRVSNLFNKISLTILGADFFQFLCDSKKSIDSVEQVEALANEWLTGVDANYFNRDWRLGGVKKDSTGIRNQWAYTWVEYRKDPTRLPRLENYRNARNP